MRTDPAVRREPRGEATPVTGWRALAGLLRPRASRGQLVVAVLCALLGFGFVTSVHTNRTPAGLAAARQEDLVRILDGLNQQSQRLRAQRDRLSTTVTRLTTSRDTARAALDDARRQADALGILAGTLPAHGPGIVVTVDDRDSALGAAQLLDAVEELRDAGAEALQINGVRIVASSYFTGDPGALAVDGTPVSAPYRLLAIGDPHTLADALRIPGGVVDSIASVGGASTRIDMPPTVAITALRPLQTPRYARPAPTKSGGSGS